MAKIFCHGELDAVIAAFDSLQEPENRLVGDVLEQHGPLGESRERVVERLEAFRIGVREAPGNASEGGSSGGSA